MAQVLREMQAYRLEVLGVSEMRWTGQGQFSSDGITVLYSGHNDQHTHGVEIFLSKGAASALIGWKLVSHRIITARLQTQQAKVTVICTNRDGGGQRKKWILQPTARLPRRDPKLWHKSLDRRLQHADWQWPTGPECRCRATWGSEGNH